MFESRRGRSTTEYEIRDGLLVQRVSHAAEPLPSWRSILVSAVVAFLMLLLGFGGFGLRVLQALGHRQRQRAAAASWSRRTYLISTLVAFCLRLAELVSLLLFVYNAESDVRPSSWGPCAPPGC